CDRRQAKRKDDYIAALNYCMMPKRLILVLGTFLLSVVLYVDRTCIATAKESISRDLGLNNERWSWVLASFAFDYALFQVPSGALADRWSGRTVLATVVV